MVKNEPATSLAEAGGSATYKEIRSAGAPAEGIDALPGVAQDVVQVEPALQNALDCPRGQIAIWHFRPEGEPSALSLSDVSPGLDGYLWIDVSEFNAASLRDIAARLDLPSALIDVTIAQWQRPRVEVQDDIALIIATLPRIDAVAHRAFAAEYDLFVAPTFLVSVHQQPATFSEDIRSRVRLSPGRLRENTSFLLYVILDELLGYYAGLAEHVAEEVELAEEQALLDSSDEFLADLLRLKRYVFALDQLAARHRAVFAALLRPDFPFAPQNDLERYFRDLEGRLSDILGAFTSAAYSVNGAFDIYVSHVSHRTNDVIRTLTLISGVLLPVSVILTGFAAFAQVASIYDPRVGVAMLAAAALTIGGALGIFRGVGWLTIRADRSGRSMVKREEGLEKR